MRLLKSEESSLQNLLILAKHARLMHALKAGQIVTKHAHEVEQHECARSTTAISVRLLHILIRVTMANASPAHKLQHYTSLHKAFPDPGWSISYTGPHQSG